MMKLIFLQLSLLIFFLGCTQQGKTPTKLEISLANFTSDLGVKANGGVYLYAFGPNGRKFGKIVNSLDYSATLPNGAWSFYAVAWDGQVGTESNLNLSGVARCGAVKGVNLTGKAVNLNLTLTKTNCGSADFTNAPMTASAVVSGATTAYFPRFMVEVCKSIPETVNQASINRMDDMYGCSYDLATETDPKNKGYLGSIKVAVESFEQYPGSGPEFENDELQSRCLPISSSGRGSFADIVPGASPVQTVDYARGLNIPVGNPNAPFPFKVIGYYATANCSDVQDSLPKEFLLMSGRLESTYNVVGNIFGLSTIGNQPSGKLFLETPSEEVCVGWRAANLTAYAGGLGTKGHPYLICNADQFNLAQASVVASPSASFKLMDDIDFGFMTTPFNPIGDNPSSATNDTMPVLYSGTFDGDYHTIRNFIYQKKAQGTDQAKIGIIRHMSGATVANLKIDQVSMECHVDGVGGSCNSVGIVAGAADKSRLMNILINRGHVNGVGDVGGVVGSVLDGGNATSPTVFRGVHVLGVIEADCDENIVTDPNYDPLASTYKCENAGGLAGRAIKASFLASSAKVNVNGHSRHVNVGGLVGSATNVSMDSIFTNGNINAKDAVGGLVGRVETSTNDSVISNSYSFSTVHGQDNVPTVPVARAGGLVGVASSLTLVNSFHSVGRVESNSASPVSTRALIGDGGSGVTCTNSFASSSESFTLGSCTNLSFSDLKDSSNFNPTTGTPPVVVVVVGTDSAARFISPDDTYDYPHLKWELNQQAFFGFEIPYISTACFGKINNSTPSGLGTESLPFEICNIDQLTGTAWNDSSHYFKLMRDLDFEFTSPGYLGVDGSMSAQFNGNFHSFKNIQMDLKTQKSLYQAISNGASIANLDFEDVGIVTGPVLDADLTEKVAIVAGVNNGTITNVNLYGAEVNTTSFNFSSGIGNQNDYTLKIGGLVAENMATIQDSVVDVKFNFLNPIATGNTDNPYLNKMADMDQVWIGGVAATHNGTIDGVRSFVRFDYTSLSVDQNLSLDDATDFIKMGSIVGENTIVSSASGLITKVEGSFDLRIINTISGFVGQGEISIGGLVGENSGSIDNSLFTNSKMFLTIGNATDITINIGGVIGKNTTNGSVTKSYAQMSDMSIPSGSYDYVGGFIGYNDQLDIDPTNNFCIVPSGESYNLFGNDHTTNPVCPMDNNFSVSCTTNNIIFSTLPSTTPPSTTVLFTLDWSKTSDPIDRTVMNDVPWLAESHGGQCELPTLRKTQMWFEDIH